MISRISLRASIHARLHWTAARLDPVSTSTIGAKTSDQAVITVRNAGGVRQDCGTMTFSARATQTAMSLRCPITLSRATSSPSSQRISRYKASRQRKAPLPAPSPEVQKWLPPIRAVVTAASMGWLSCPRPTRLQRLYPLLHQYEPADAMLIRPGPFQPCHAARQSRAAPCLRAAAGRSAPRTYQKRAPLL